MRVPKRILLMATLAMVGILGPQAAPADAAMAGGFVAVGQATTSGNLSSPVGPGCLGLCPSPGHVTFSFSAHGVGGLADTAGPSVAGPSFSIHGHGSVGGVPKTAPTVGPYCGLSTGSVTAHASWTGTLGSFHGSFTAHWTVGVGSVLLLTGTGGTSAVVAVALAVPPNPVTGGGSCLSGTATDFTVVTAGVTVHA